MRHAGKKQEGSLKTPNIPQTPAPHLKRPQSCLPYFFIGSLLLPSLYWIAANRAVWPWDQAWYGEVSVELWRSLSRHPLTWPQALLKAFETKAPGIAWVGEFFVPIGRMTGSIDFGLLLSILLTQFCTLALTYLTVLELTSGQILMGVLGVAIAASSPLFIGLSHQYFVEPLQLLGAAYIFWIAAAGARWDRLRILGHLFLATGIGMAAKASTPLYCILPGIIGLVHFSKSSFPVWEKGRTALARQFAFPACGFIVLATSAAWYIRNLSHVLAFIVQSSSGAVALDYGRRASFAVKLQYWLSEMAQNFFPRAPIALAVLLAVAVGLFFLRRRAYQRPSWAALSVIAAATIELLTVLFVFSKNINEETRYLLPLLPSLVIIFTGLLHIFGSPRPVVMVAVLLFAAQWAVVHGQATGLLAPIQGTSNWVRTVDRDARRAEELTRLIQCTTSERTANRYIVDGVEYPWLNANSLSFYAAKEELKSRRRCFYVSLGYAEKDEDKAWQRIFDAKSVYYISVEANAQPKQPDFLNIVSLPTLERVEADRRFVQEPFDSEFSIALFRNTQEIP